MHDIASLLEFTFGMDSARFDQKLFLSQYQRYPPLTAETPCIVDIKKGSTVVTIETSNADADTVVEAFARGDAELQECLSGFPIRNVRKLDMLGRRLKDGDESVLSDILDAHREYIDRQLDHLGVKNKDDRDDFITITLYAIWEKRCKYDPSQLCSRGWWWLNARNYAIDVFRKLKRKDPEVDIDKMQLANQGAAETTELSSDAMKMRKAMSKLDATDQAILTIYANEDGQSGWAQKAAKYLGLGAELIRQRRARAFEKIRKFFDA